MSTRRVSRTARSSSVLRRLPSVFINCPFDSDYSELFEAILFTCTCYGFNPRSALESGSVSSSRMTRIFKALRESQYSIHDLSRCTGEGPANLARFNMPLELGMAMAIGEIGRNSHDWLVLVPEGHVYKQFISDLSGFDPSSHDGSLERLVSVVAAWLITRPDAVPTAVRPIHILESLPLFRQNRRELAEEWKGEPPWEQSVRVAAELAGSILSRSAGMY